MGKEEHVGQHAIAANSGTYVKGTIETELEESVHGVLRNFIEVVAIITDDLPKDLKGSGYVSSPDSSGHWIFPRNARTTNGELATSITTNIPSSFRDLPLHDSLGRRVKKFDFESKVYQVVHQSSADIILSDHFLARFEFLIDPNYYPMLGRVLNTHPGITRNGHPYTTRGQDTYSHMRNHARGLRQHPDGSFYEVTPHARAGASFHIVTSDIDQGPVLCDGELTSISPDDSDEMIAHKMYATSKYHVFIEGIRHYATNIHPLLAPQWRYQAESRI